ncbi:hypothetical protein N9064_00580 [bacterium]|nr:hypothetical protein [bacterium]
MKIHILEHSTNNFKHQRSYHSFTSKCLNPIGIGGEEPIIHTTWESVLASGATHVLYLYPPFGQPALPALLEALPKGKDNNKTDGDGKPIGIKQIRGSRYFHQNIEIIPTYHPLTTLGSFKNWWLIGIDFKRYIKDSKEGYKQPEFTTHICDNFSKAITYLNKLYSLPITYGDIEGALETGAVSCIGFSLSEREGFTIPFCDMDGYSIFSLEEEVLLWDRIQHVLTHVTTGWQNCLYDLFVLAYAYGITVDKCTEDTMIKFWELFCEFPKGLGFLVSVLTDNPYYKDERTAGTLEAELIYNIKDCCLTHECDNKLNQLLARDPLAVDHYRLQMDTLPTLLYIMLQGMWIDQGIKGFLLANAIGEVKRLQGVVNNDWLETDLGKAEVVKFNKSQEAIKTLITEQFDLEAEYKKEFEIKPLKKWENKIAVCSRKIVRLKKKLHDLEKPVINVKSSKQKDTYMYSKLGLKLKKPAKKLAENNDGEEKTATEGILIIKKMVNKTTPDKVKVKLQNLLLLINARTKVSDIQKLTVDKLDGRFRFNLNLVGTQTGRMNSSKSNIPISGFKNFI